MEQTADGKANSQSDPLGAGTPAIGIHDCFDHSPHRVPQKAECDEQQHDRTKRHVVHLPEGSLGIGRSATGAKRCLSRENPNGDIEDCFGGIAHPREPLYPGRHVSHFDRSAHRKRAFIHTAPHGLPSTGIHRLGKTVAPRGSVKVPWLLQPLNR
jgi:hypothetical protein